VEVLAYGEQVPQTEYAVAQTSGPGFLGILSIIYITGLVVLFLKLLIAVANIIRLIGRSRVEGRLFSSRGRMASPAFLPWATSS
jgi:sorbitol-specific phosphotransferase system component IIC